MLRILVIPDDGYVIIDAEPHPMSRSDMGELQINRAALKLVEVLRDHADIRFLLALRTHLGCTLQQEGFLEEEEG